MSGPIFMPGKGNAPKDRFVIEVLPDGRIKILTDAFSAPVHTTAERFLGEVARLMGGQVTREAREDRPHEHHTHEDGTSHSHA